MYCKLFASLYQGTLRGRSDEILVFTNLLAHTSAGGIVDKHFRAIAEETGLSIDRVKQAITILESPDEESRSPDEDGARLVRLDEHRVWGWRVVNHGKYRAIKNEDDRAEQNRLAQMRFRERKKAEANGEKSAIVSSVSSVSPDKPKQKHKAEAEADSLSPLFGGVEREFSRKFPVPDSVAGLIKKLYNRREKTQWSEDDCKAAKNIQFIPESDLLADLAVMSKARAKGWTAHRQDPATLMNNWQMDVDRANSFLKSNPAKVGNF